MKRKTFYEAPEAELIFVNFEENILSGDNANGTENADVDDPYGPYAG